MSRKVCFTITEQADKKAAILCDYYDLNLSSLICMLINNCYNKSVEPKILYRKGFVNLNDISADDLQDMLVKTINVKKEF